MYLRHFNYDRQNILESLPRGGADFLVSASDVRGISSDARLFPLRLAVVSTHSNAINCSDAPGRRWTLLTDRWDFLPRSALLGFLPAARSGDLIAVDFSNTPVIFKARFLNTVDRERWSGLIGEWADFLNDSDLTFLRSAVLASVPLHSLSGLGSGFTPEGDDFITGWITAKLSVGTWDARAEVRFFYENWNQASTTWFSKWMIKDAARGRIWRRGTVLLEAMSQGKAGGVTDAVTDIINWGHTSGRAWLAGFACGFVPEGAAKGMILCKN